MKHYIVCSLLILFFTSPAFAQIPKDKIETKLAQADSVLIVSHEDTWGENIQAREKAPKLIENGRINYRIIYAVIKLTKNDIDSLAPIFSRLSENIPPREETGCLRLKHAILILKNDNVSFIDLSFECQSFLCSKDLDVKNNIIEYDKWTMLEMFFKQKKVSNLLK